MKLEKWERSYEQPYFKKTISEEIIRQVKERDNNKCVNCGKNVEVIHHIYPKGRGGKDELNNLICLCLECHDMVHTGGHTFISFWIRHFKELIK